MTEDPQPPAASDPRPPRADGGTHADGRSWRGEGHRPGRGHGPGDRHGPWRHRGIGGPPWRRRQGFGCLFGLLFFVIVASILTALASMLSTLGPLPVVIAVVVVVGIVSTLMRGMMGAARDLDRMLAAARRVQDGDYTARVGRTRSDMRPVQELARGFDTMVARLETDEEQRRTLLADVSHELRTPLTVITGNLEAIVDGVYPADPAHLATILDETRVMERLIDDLRTVALSEAGTLTLHPEPTDPDLLLAEVARSFGPAAEAAGVTLTTDAPDDLPIVDLDPVRIREVLSNLVANALRHTPQGGSIVLGGAVDGARIVLTVRDSGPGIDPALLPHVFERFVKGESSRGSGLGLAIARGLVEAHRGSISVDSPSGGGTTFRVELPGSDVA